jgi:sodium-dependent phosphate cotransporter
MNILTEKRVPPWMKKVLEAVLFVFFLYCFLLSIQLMSKGFNLFGQGLAEKLLRTTSNPFVGLFIGILATSMVHSSSLITSIVVGLVAGNLLSITNAIPIIMGSNIGTTVTNVIVSLGLIGKREEFRRAFAGATVHDFFNIMTVIILFPFQYYFNYLGWVSTRLTDLLGRIGGFSFASPLQAITDPPAEFLVGLLWNNKIVILLFSLLVLFISLILMVKYMKALIISKAEAIFERVIFRTKLQGMLFGLAITSLVQSSSVTTSLVVPLAGAGMLKLDRIFPYTMGANIGTTVTAILAALALNNPLGISAAFAHTMFNVTGVLIFWWLQFIPIGLAQGLSNLAYKNRAYAIIYVIVVFYAIPILMIWLFR